MLYRSARSISRRVWWAVVIMLTLEVLLPQAPVLAAAADNHQPERQVVVEKNDAGDQYKQEHFLPVNDVRVKRKIVVQVTAYNAVPEQTDSSPCISADGTDVCQTDLNIVAANFLPFGTKIRIPQYFGDTIFEVHDRMNARYNYRVDVLMDSVQQAKQFGIRTLEIEIL